MTLTTINCIKITTTLYKMCSWFFCASRVILQTEWSLSICMENLLSLRHAGLLEKKTTTNMQNKSNQIKTNFNSRYHCQLSAYRQSVSISDLHARNMALQLPLFLSITAKGKASFQSLTKIVWLRLTPTSLDKGVLTWIDLIHFSVKTTFKLPSRISFR